MVFHPYAPNDLLSRLVGDRMYSVEFVLNDYVQFRFDGSAQGDRPVTLKDRTRYGLVRDPSQRGGGLRHRNRGEQGAERRCVDGVASRRGWL